MEIGAIELLRNAGDVSIPLAVDQELRQAVSDWEDVRPAWLHVVAPEVPETQEIEGWLRAGVIHAGEAEAIGLARQMKAEWFLTDDTAARLLARGFGLEVHGSLGVVLWAAATRLVDSERAHILLESLGRSSLWISPHIMREARAALESMFPGA